MTYAVRIEGPLAADRLALALETLRGRHPALRTRVLARDGAIVQVVDDGSEPSPGIEVRQCAEGEEAYVSAVEATRQATSPGDTPWRARLLRHSASSHTLIVCAHRCVWDEPSANVLGAQLSALYDGEARLDLGAATGPASNSRAESGGDGARHFAAGLVDVPPLHGFPVKTSRPPLLSVDAAAVEMALEPDVAVRLAREAQECGVRPFMILATAVAYVLAQFSGQRKLAVGMPFSLRRSPSLEAAIGSHTSMLPLGFDAAWGPTLRDLTRAFDTAYRAAEPHAGTAFHEVVRECGARTDPAANPLFQIGFVEEVPLGLTLAGCECAPRPVPPPPQQLDLFFQIGPRGLRLGYASQIIDGGMALSLCRSVSSVLEAALRHPGTSVHDLPLLAGPERDALLRDVNRTEEPSYLEPDLYALLTRHAGRSNSRPALVGSGASLSYAELGEAVESVAARLAGAGVTSGELVGICLPRSVEMVTTMLAVLRGGQAYVPLDPAFPRPRLTYMLEHARLRCVVTTSVLRPIFEGSSVQLIELDGPGAVGPVSPLPASVPADSPAYVIYTSGSTGQPKGVVVPRGAVANFLQSMLDRPGLGKDDTVCAITTLSFDIAVLELLAPLSAGGTVVIATEEDARDPRRLAALMKAHPITVVQATPVTWQMLCASGWAGDPQLVALCGGEALTPALARLLRPRVRALWNMYGPTETTVWSTCHPVDDPGAPISIGTPIGNTLVYVLDDHLRPVPAGVEGELFIGGAGVALGYLRDEDLTRRRFVADPFRSAGRMYDTGDRAKIDDRGLLHVLGRRDFQIKLRGFRIELGEVEARLASFPGLEQVAAVVRRDNPDNPELVAYYTLKPGEPAPATAELRQHCASTLPAYMVPSRLVSLEALPLTPNGKVDRNALPRPGDVRPGDAPPAPPSMPRSEVEKTLTAIWQEVLGTATVGIHDSFFDLGGTSLAALSVAQQIGDRFGVEVPVLAIFEHPTVAALGQFLKGLEGDHSYVREAYGRAARRRGMAASETAFDVAIVGAAGRFPGARNLGELWENLAQGRNTVTVFARDEIDPLVPRHEREDPAYVPARGVLEDSDLFDARFFGVNPREAELTDPQLRVFLEVAWEAMESAGYVGERVEGLVGVWAGMGNNFYYHYNVLTRPDKLAVIGEIAAEIANEKDHIAPRVSHKLNLTGPSLSVHTACSTTLVVIENAYQALVTHQVDMALAGGVDIRTPQRSGQRFEEGGVFSKDGQCRPFDADATGTMFGEGAGAVVLKRLDDALADDDTILAVIKGAAVNHDGGRKVSYLAPSVEGQARVVATAMGIGGVRPDTVTFIEAHGTATPIGDPIEVEALTRVYRAFTPRKRFCVIGSIKGNFGHATTAAGIAGLLKVVLCLRHRQIPATVHFKRPNPRIDFESSPFFVNTSTIDWESPEGPRRAGVSSFGFCGTNAHVVLEEAPVVPASPPPARPWHLLLLSARDQRALDAAATRLGGALEGMDGARLADAAFTTQVGRKRFEHRRCAVVTSGAEAAAAVGQAAGSRSLSLASQAEAAPVAFMFPGQGSQYVNMGRQLYGGEAVFRESVDRCAAALAPHMGCDLREFLFPEPADAERATQSLNNTFYTQPAIFTISYSLATLWGQWGVRPTAFIGHSIGEFVGAALSGVMELEDALRLVATRGRLMQALPHGSMLSVRLPLADLEGRLPPGVDVAASNAPQLCVLAGPTEPLQRLAEEFQARGVNCRLLHTSHAFHSSMMDPVVEPFLRTVETVPLSPPRIPFVSTVTGDWARPEEVTDPSYWARHLRSPVRFSQAVQTALGDGGLVLLECGPRRTCGALALQHRPPNPDRVVSTMPDSAEPEDEYPSLLLAAGALWLNGATIDWDAFHHESTRRRVPLPTYPFQRKRYWVEPGPAAYGTEEGPRPAATAVATDVEETNESTPGVGRDAATAGLVKLLEETLGAELGVFDEDARFVALGLDSLLLTQLARLVRTRLGFEVSFRQLTERYSTTRLLADAIRESATRASEAAPAAGKAAAQPPLPATAASAAPPVAGARLGRDERGQPAWFVLDPSRPGKYLQVATRASAGARELPSTPAQREMWRFSRTHPEQACAFNEAVVIRLTGLVDQAALAAGLQSLAEHHEALRGRLAADGQRLVLAPSITVPVTRHDLSSLVPGARADALAAVLAADARAPYDLESGPLLRAAVVCLEAREHVVLLAAHRAVCDGWSLDVLLYDLGRLYSALAGGVAPPAPPAHAFSDYVAYRATPQFAARVGASRAFWRDALQGLPAPPAGAHSPASVAGSLAASHATRTVSPDLVATARSFARASSLSFFSVLLTTAGLVLHRLYGADDLTIAVPVAGHPDAAMEECVGHLASTLPIRIRFVPGGTFRQLAEYVNRAVLDARENAAVELGEIATEIGTGGGQEGPGLASVVFTHVLKYPPEKLRFADCGVEYRFNPREVERFACGFTVVDSAATLELSAFAGTETGDVEWLSARLAEFERLLREGCAEPEGSLRG